MAKNPAYTPEQDEWLRQNIKGKGYKEIVPAFNKKFNENRTISGLRQHCKTTLKINTGLTTTPNVHPIGTILTVTDKSQNTTYQIIKISNKKWKPYATYVWEQHYNKTLKSNERIIHLDGDLLNNNITNLYKTKLSVQLVVFHTYKVQSGNPEIIKTAIMNQELKQIIKEKENGSKNILPYHADRI